MFKVLIVGCGNMGASHALAYTKMSNCKIVGIVAPSAGRRALLAQKLHDLNIEVNQYDDFFKALNTEKPDIVCIASYSETHADYAIAAMEFGSHVFLEKPIATNLDDAHRVFAVAKRTKKKLVIGLILRHHPSWQKFIEISHSLGKPLVMRMNLNQQSSGSHWQTHCKLMESLSPLVDCGVHYVDIMCQMTRSKPVKVYATGARLANNVAVDNYGMLQLTFADGSVGWYEAGWGPMISTNAYFIKDVIGPEGCASIVPNKESLSDSSNVDSHTAAENILLHHSGLNPKGEFIKKDDLICLDDEPDHLELCLREQNYLLNAIINDVDLTSHIQGSIESLAIVLAADNKNWTSGDARELNHCILLFRLSFRRRPESIKSLDLRLIFRMGC